jgi:hypothetical protein
MTIEFTRGQNPNLLNDLLTAVKGDSFWEKYLTPLVMEKHPSFSLHLAVMVEPFLQFVLEGRKTIESRFSANRCAPYKRITKNDVVLLKRTGGPIVGICQVSSSWFYELDPSSWNLIKEKFTQALCADTPGFWEDRQAAAYATLMRVQRVRLLSPIRFEKRDRRGWVVLLDATPQMVLQEAFE